MEHDKIIGVLTTEQIEKSLYELLHDELSNDYLPAVSIEVKQLDERLLIRVNNFNKILELSWECQINIVEYYEEEGINSYEVEEEEFREKVIECMNEKLDEINPRPLDINFKIADLEVQIYTYEAEGDYDDYGIVIELKLPRDQPFITPRTLANWIKTLYDMVLTFI